jgi:hypothetical protein
VHLTGRFSSTAGDASGTAVLQRIPVPNRVAEYRGLPLEWFSRLVEVVTATAYRNEWNQLNARVNDLAITGKEFWKTHNCHLLVAALVLAEDRRFYSHGGVDPIAMCRALFKTIFGSKIQGGSTIEQQLVRVLTSDYRKSLKRKVKEIVLAVRLHRVLGKNQIPVVYLVSAYFGWHMNGVRQAAQRLSINLKDPTVEDAARLIARIRYPEPHHPSARLLTLATKREEWVARRLLAKNISVVLNAPSMETDAGYPISRVFCEKWGCAVTRDPSSTPAVVDRGRPPELRSQKKNLDTQC